MKSRLFTAFCVILIIAACTKNSSTVKPVSIQSFTHGKAAYRLPLPLQDTVFTGFIPVDSANKMINSYLYSINAQSNDTDIKSFTINADSLRAYLNNTEIKNIKLVFAHTLNYINAGYKDQYAGYQSGGLTMVIVGYDNLGNYEYHGGMVLDHIAPCPFACPPGDAGDDLLQ